MKKYNPSELVSCSKCGNSGRLVNRQFNICYKKDEEIGNKFLNERIQITCNNCGFSWDKEPLNLGEVK